MTKDRSTSTKDAMASPGARTISGELPESDLEKVAAGRKAGEGQKDVLVTTPVTPPK
jgi:hypothetical protein